MTTKGALDTETVQVSPGAGSSVPVQIWNNGDIVEGYEIEVVGAPAEWATVEPRYVSLYPGTSATAEVAFHPPPGAALPAGDLPFGVRVVPTEHPDEAVVHEGVVQVLPLVETTAEVLPRTSRGRLSARHRIAVDNRGNVAVPVRLTVRDPNQTLRFRIRPDELVVEAGHASFAALRVRPGRPLWRGMAISHQYQVVATAPGASSSTLDATYVQEPRLPAWLGRAVAAVLVLALLLAGAWYKLLKPTVESAARQAVEAPVQQARNAAEQAGSAAGNAQGSAGDADAAAKKAEDLVGTPPRPPRTTVEPTADRLRLRTGKGATESARHVVERNEMLEITDLVLANPQGDFGRVTVQVADRALLDLALENFRDTDYHFGTPLRLTAGQALTLTVRCNAVGSPPNATPAPSACDTALFFGGKTTTILRRSG